MDKESSMFIYTLNRQKLRQVRRREGRYLLRTNLIENDPALLWQYYNQLVAVEEAFKNLKQDLAIRPVFHHHERRIEAICSSPSWPTACKSPCSVGCTRWRRD
jgi:transposase